MTRAAREPSSRLARLARFAWPVALVAVTLIAYAPALRGGWVWDDDYYVTRNVTLRSLAGLGRIWSDRGAVPQYYPLTHTTFWLEWRLWGDHPAGYHVANVLLHCANAILAGVLLRRLAVPGWWIVPWVFALHPVHVESVAWVTERKNVLSGLFYLLALAAYLRFVGATLDFGELSRAVSPSLPAEKQGATQVSPLRWKWYSIAIVFFVCALLSKSVTSSLPAVVLLIVFWKRGRIAWKDVPPLLPLFVLGVAMGTLTSWMEREVVGAKGPEWALSFLDRVLIAGRAVWFYATKLIWPHPLIFMYQRWRIDPAQLWQFAFPLAAAGVVVSLWMLRNRLGRGPLVAVLFFGGTLFPALGFVNVLPMRYSFVADHFQYLASLGLLTLVAAGLGRLLPTRVAGLLTGILCLALGVLTWRHARDFKDLETLWTRTLAKNPTSWMAHNNYGTLLQERGEYDAATREFRQAIALKPDHVRARLNLGVIAERRKDFDAARALYEEALAIQPDFADGHYNFGRLLASQGKFDEAAAHYRQAIVADPRNEAAHTNLGVLLAERGDAEGAMTHYRRALEIDPNSFLARVNLGNLYLNAGRVDDALAEWNRALAIQPRSHLIRNNIGLVLAAQGRLDDADKVLREALALKPDSVDVLTNLGIVRARKGDRIGAERYLNIALKLDPNNAKARAQLDAMKRR